MSAFAVFVALAVPGTAAAEELHVTRSFDILNADGTLRTVAAAANDGDTIVIDRGVFPSLLIDDVVINDDVTIRGQGKFATAINGNRMSRIFDVGATAAVTIEDMSLVGGEVPEGTGGVINGAPGESGGAIFNEADLLTLRRVSIRDSKAGNGGVGDTGTGGAGGGGGGVFSAGGDVVLVDSTVAQNATGFGGSGATPSDSGAHGRGGGIEVGGDANLTVINSTISGNVSGVGRGGGIHSSGNTLTVINSTISENLSTSGAAIFEDSLASATIINSTLADNETTGISRSPGPQTVTLQNSILANNGQVGGFDVENCQVNGFVDGGNNIAFPIDDDGMRCPASFTIADPLLGPLADNGGLSLTSAPAPGSAALDKVPASACGSATDQRGLPRPSGPLCDIGAYELQQPTLPAVATPPAATPAAPAVTKKCKKKNGKKSQLAAKKCKKKKRKG